MSSIYLLQQIGDDLAIILNESAGPTPSSITASQVTVDFGTVPVYSKSFTVTDVAVTSTTKLCVVPSGTSDELEMDNFVCAAKSATGSFTLYATAIPGPVTGQRTFNYLLG